ncbi:MAG TPA: hypothetical protein VN670_02615 [Acidobacteriaceae bacterium]|nr:hypothetical protein [Acidobacteriaceae bacterium]
MRETISIWWFSGLLLFCYGIVILATGIYELSHPLAHPPTLSYLHAPIWWGALLAIVGVVYLVRFHPKKIGTR